MITISQELRTIQETLTTFIKDGMAGMAQAEVAMMIMDKVEMVVITPVVKTMAMVGTQTVVMIMATTDMAMVIRMHRATAAIITMPRTRRTVVMAIADMEMVIVGAPRTLTGVTRTVHSNGQRIIVQTTAIVLPIIERIIVAPETIARAVEATRT
jgi:hypothetical protein